MKYYGIKINYFILLICALGYMWIIYNIYQDTTSNINNSGFNVCIIKNVTGLPCPSCGTTRAVSLLINGDLYKSIILNPFGIIVFSILFIFPFWIVYDLILNKSTFETWFIDLNKYFKKKWIVILFILIVLFNWFWNIYKNL